MVPGKDRKGSSWLRLARLGIGRAGERASLAAALQDPSRDLWRESSVIKTLNTTPGGVGMSGEKFGEFVRREREAKEIGLREMAKMIGVSPTYLSKVERDQFAPPTEDRVRKIAAIIECDPDWLLAMAGRRAAM